MLTRHEMTIVPETVINIDWGGRGEIWQTLFFLAVVRRSSRKFQNFAECVTSFATDCSFHSTFEKKYGNVKEDNSVLKKSTLMLLTLKLLSYYEASFREDQCQIFAVSPEASQTSIVSNRAALQVMGKAARLFQYK